MNETVNNIFDLWRNKENGGNGMLLQKEYKDVLTEIAEPLIAGKSSRQKALKEAMNILKDIGLPIFIDCDGREWKPKEYLDMHISTLVNNAGRKKTHESMKKSGKDIIEVSSHNDARPSCEPYQGKFYSISGKSGIIHDVYGNEYTYEPLSSTNHGELDGLFGIDCNHEMYPVSDGLFVKIGYEPTEEELKN